MSADDQKQSQLRELAKLALARKDSVLVKSAAEKLAAGKPISKREETALALAAAGADPADAKNFAANWEELAQAIGITPRGLRDARARFPDDQPRDRADGRKEVAAWLEWMRKHGIKRADEYADPDEIPEERRSIRDWKEQREKLQCIKLEREIDRGDGKLLVAAELEEPLGATFVAVQNKLAQFPERVAPSVAGFTDVPEIIGILRAEIDADLSALHEASYLAEVEALTSDPHVAELVREVLRRIGRRAIAAARSLPADPLPPVNGQVTDEAADDQRQSRGDATRERRFWRRGARARRR
jgi:hypothetical protein